MAYPLMPKATAVWLVDNTGLTFEQIADFCGLHKLEVQGIADGEVAQNMVGADPVSNGQLTREEIERCEADPKARLELKKSDMPEPKRRKGPRYTPVSKRQERPDAIAWLVRYHPELTDAEIGRLVGTTKPTIQSIRERTHWNISNLSPTDPVALGLCSQIELDAAVQKAAKRVEKKEGKVPQPDVPETELLQPDLSKSDQPDIPGPKPEPGPMPAPAADEQAAVEKETEPEPEEAKEAAEALFSGSDEDDDKS